MTGTFISATEVHRCKTPGSSPPREEWPRKPVPAFGSRPISIPVLYSVGTLWRCGDCGKWFTAIPTRNHFRYGYQPEGREWRPVRWWDRSAQRRIKRGDRG